MRRRLLVCLAALALLGAPAVSRALPTPPLRTSPNVQLLMNIPGSAAGMAFEGNYAFVTGWTGLQVLDISDPASPRPAGELALPHFENEDVDLCGDTLLISNDREKDDYGSILYVVDISNPTLPTVTGVLPLGLTGQGRGSGHIANFVKRNCTQAWIDGGNLVEVVDLTDPSAPRSLGKFESVASRSEGFNVTHDTELDSTGTVWSVGGGGAAGYQLTRNPLKPKLLGSTGTRAVNHDFNDANSPLNDFILHNSQRRGKTLLITEEDYIDQDQAQPGSCHGQGKFETWSLRDLGKGKIRPLDTWQTELNGFLAGGEAEDSKAPVTANCSSHWFDERGGVAAVGWYEQGVRFLDVHAAKNIRQVGYYLPVDGSTWAAYWSPTDPTGQIVYAADPARGVDVLRIEGGGRASGTPTTTAPILDSWFGTPTVTSAAYQRSSTFGSACLVRVS